MSGWQVLYIIRCFIECQVGRYGDMCILIQVTRKKAKCHIGNNQYFTCQLMHSCMMTKLLLSSFTMDRFLVWFQTLSCLDALCCSLRLYFVAALYLQWSNFTPSLFVYIQALSLSCSVLALVTTKLNSIVDGFFVPF